MKQLSFLIVFFVLIACCNSYGQKGNGEFQSYSNGFIYSDSAMGKLRLIVDSLNIRFRTCDPYKVYYSFEQSIGHYVSLDGKGHKQAVRDIKSGIAYNTFKEKYPGAKVNEHMLLVRELVNTEEDKERTAVFGINGGDWYSRVEIDKHWLTDHRNSGKWVVQTYDGGMSAFYILQDFTAIPLSAPYDRMVQYVDCMIDTNAQIYFKSAEKQLRGYSKTLPASKAFFDYINKLTSRPDEKSYPDDEKGRSAWYEAYFSWDTAHIHLLDERWPKDDRLRELFANALHEARERNVGNRWLEEYAGRYVSKADALSMKRNRIVVGGCSMDQSPRIHAMEIATLSAETFNWEIFLRSHMDIMNDNFRRVSDGSYAWGGRMTYIAELEALNIDVTDLLLGTCFRISNPSGTHYFGSVDRLGRAFTESKDRTVFEQRIADAVRDTALDAFNRMVMFNLFRSYVAYLEDGDHKSQQQLVIADCLKTLPDCLVKHIKLRQDE